VGVPGKQIGRLIRIIRRKGGVKYLPGYIKTYRDIQNHWVWKEKPFSRGQAWIDLILMANHSPAKFPLGSEMVEVDRGSFITSELKLMERWGWSKTKVRIFLDLLQNDSMIIKKTDHKKTTLTVTNYSVWQDSETTEEPKKDQKKTNKKPKKDTNNNEKNVNNEKDIYISVQHLSMAKIEYDKLVSIYGQEKVTNKIAYAENYAKLKNYKSLYLTLNNWLSLDTKKDPPQTNSPYREVK
jgi:hypothetical protein